LPDLASSGPPGKLIPRDDFIELTGTIQDGSELRTSELLHVALHFGEQQKPGGQFLKVAWNQP
jgi:hypothetical protein